MYGRTILRVLPDSVVQAVSSPSSIIWALAHDIVEGYLRSNSARLSFPRETVK